MMKKALLYLLLSISGVNAQGLGNAVAEFGDWTVFVGLNGKNKVCYAASQPKERMPKNLNRDPAYIYISTRPAERVTNEFSITLGFPHKEKTDAEAVMGLLKIPLHTIKEGAWVKNGADEGKLFAQMKASPTLLVKGVSLRGNALTDTYSLKGLSQALERVASECKA